MIQINATLFIQMFNFIVAWKVLDTFLLRSCVAEIQKERQGIAVLEHSVTYEIDALKKAEEQQMQVIVSIRKKFIAALPPVVQDIAPKAVPLNTFSFSRACDTASRQRITEEAVAFLVKRVTNV